MRNESELVKKNLEISFEFSRYVLAHPAVGTKIPDNALIAFHVADDPALTKFNKNLVKRTREPGQPVVTVWIQGLASTRLIKPTLKPASA